MPNIFGGESLIEANMRRLQAQQQGQLDAQLEAQDAAQAQQANALMALLPQGPQAPIQQGGMTISGIGGGASPAALEAQALAQADPSGQLLREFLGARMTQTPQQLADAELARDQVRAQIGASEASAEASRQRVAQMNAQTALAASEARRAIWQQGFDISSDLRGEVNRDPIVLKTAEALKSYDQFNAAIEQNNQVALQSAIVALAQIQEPGLAVRQDDRLAYTGNNPAMERLVNFYNGLVTGEVEADTAGRMIELATELVTPWAQSVTRVLNDYRGLALRTPGVTPQDVILGTGLDFDTIDALLNE